MDTVRILIAAGVPVNHVNNLGWTAMQEAILLNNGGPRQQEVVRQLLAAGADPDIRDPQGRTALENAERLGFGDIAKLIRSAPASGDGAVPTFFDGHCADTRNMPCRRLCDKGGQGGPRLWPRRPRAR